VKERDRKERRKKVKGNYYGKVEIFFTDLQMKPGIMHGMEKKHFQLRRLSSRSSC
jgi:hypothetical protein